MAKKQFPQLIHVVWEEPENDEPFLSFLEGGVSDVDEPNKPIAVYKLVEVGKVEIKKRFVTKK